ncbi:MAG TPA: hypothetical protein VJU18_16680 [Vicinamibacteria bacterium]|nr:hypothetical protein [Vicinamibacteria bacterium]
MSDHPRRLACDQLARLLATEDGLRAARLRQLIDFLAPKPEKPALPGPPAPPLRARSPRAPAPTPIGPWKPEGKGDQVVWVRAEGPGLGDPWPPQPELRPKAPGGPFRIVLLGESAAAGWFYAPQMTPAGVLQEQLAQLTGPNAYEVLNLAKVDLTAGELMALATAAVQLRPDALLVYAGNNWPQRFRNQPPPGFAGSLEAAAAFRADGMRGLARLAEEAGLRAGEEALRRLAGAAKEVGAAVILVVPEVNLGAWERARPPVWLAGDGCRRWHTMHAEVVGLLRDGRLAETAEAAQRMIDLDQGLCPTSHRLLAQAWLGLGRHREAAQAARAEVDARAWDNTPQMPGLTSAVQTLLRSAAREHGFRLVDLPEVFAEQAEAPLPGRRLFLDYCHLSLQGMKVSMAAVAAEVLAMSQAPPSGAWRELLAKVSDPVVPAELEARAQVMAALYGAHWASPADGGAPAIEAWIDAALATGGGARELIEGYARSRAAPVEVLLVSAEQQRVFAQPGRAEHHIWSALTLDPDALRAMARAGIGNGDPGAALLPHHGVEARGRVDLLQEAHHWRLIDQPKANTSATDNRLAYYPALWPVARFCLVSDASRDLHLDLVARLPSLDGPRQEEVAVAVNGTEVARVLLSSRWTRARPLLPQAALQPGINELALCWPLPPASGDLALARIGERLDLRIGVELHPVFGEIARLRAEAMNES